MYGKGLPGREKEKKGKERKIKERMRRRRKKKLISMIISCELIVILLMKYPEKNDSK